MFDRMARGPLLLLLAAAACTPKDSTTRDESGAVGDTTAASATAEAKRIATASGLNNPEAVRYDPDLNLWFVANINGNPSAKDRNGYISRLKSDGSVDSLKFIESGKRGAILNAPKGMAIVGDTLWVADLDAVRAFNKRTGAPLTTVTLTGRAKFLNDIAVGPDGIYVTDSGLEGEKLDHKGPDQIFRIANRKATVALTLKNLAAPNGITWDSAGSRFVIAPFGASKVVTWAPGDSAPAPLAEGKGQFDGIEPLGNERFLITTWADSSLDLLANGQLTRLAGGLPSPADIGFDRKQGRVAVPLLLENRVEFLDLPAGTR
jgi:SMP-30/Gluconolactonase/LRE-like region